MVEHAAVNRGVAGSSPVRGAYGAMVKWLRHRPFTAITGVQISLASLICNLRLQLIAIRNAVFFLYEILVMDL